MRKAGMPGAKERPMIAPAQLVNLSLYSRAYEGFMVIGWPDGLQYPADAASIDADERNGPITGWRSYRILQAFYIGTKTSEGMRQLLKFHKVDLGMCIPFPVYFVFWLLMLYQS